MPEQAPVDGTPAAAAAAAPPIDPAIKAELDRQMAISLNEGALPQEAGASEGGAGAAPVVSTPAGAPSDPFGIFTEKFGYKSPEEAVQEIEALRAFRSAPPAPQLQFENEESRFVAEALQKGDYKPIYEVLDQRMKIDRLTAGDMTPETAAEVVKLGMQLKYKEQNLTPAEIDYKFNKQYGLPPKPGMLPAEDQDEYNERVAAWQAQVADRQMELMIDAKIARPELTSSKSKLVFPTIARPQETEFQQWRQSIVENDRLAAEATLAYKAITPTSLAMKLHFSDEPNKINFDFTHEPDPESFKVAMDLVSDMEKFWNHFHHSDGTPDRQGFFKFVYAGLNAEKIVNDALHQSKNATMKSKLPDNSTGGLVRNLPQGQEQVSELDAYMRASLKGHGGF